MNNVQRILKRVLACTAAIVLAVTLCLAAAAEVAYQPTAQFFVNDFADVLSAQTEQEIVELGRALQQQTGAQAVAVTVPSLAGKAWRIMPLTWQTAGALARQRKTMACSS